MLSQFDKARRHARIPFQNAPDSAAPKWAASNAQVTHAKNKWKAVLRSGIVTLNGKDCVFNTATGDFSW